MKERERDIKRLKIQQTEIQRERDRGINRETERI